MIKLHTIDQKNRQTLNRIKSGIYFDLKLTPYTKKTFETLENYFNQIEEYENSLVISKAYKTRFHHNTGWK